jgi:hypothetical protein
MATVPMNRRVASNPQKKRSSNNMTEAAKKAFVARMAKARRKSKNPTNKTTKRKAPASNKAKRNPNRKPCRRNPNYLADPKGIAINIVAALLSAVATRQLPQMILKEDNTGWKGYLANVAAGVGSTFAASEFVSTGAAQAAMIGSGVILLDRVLTEQFSPVGKYLSLTGLGDATAATSLGTIADGYYIHPTIFDSAGNPIIPHEITDAAVRAFNQLQPAAPAGTPARTVPALPAAPLTQQGAGRHTRGRYN